MDSLTRRGLTREWLLEWSPRVRRGILLGVIGGVPLVFLRATNDVFNVPKLALLVAGTGLAAALRTIELIQGANGRPLRRLLVPATLVLVPLLLAAALSPYRYFSLFGYYGRFQGLIPYAVAILLGVLVADAFAGRVRQVAWAVSIAGGVAGAYAVLQYLGVDPFVWAQAFGGQTTQTSTLGNPNFTGGFLAIVLPVAASLWFVDPDNRNHVWKVVALIIGGQILSFSQGGYVATAAGAAVFAGFYLAPRFGWARLAGLAVAVLLGLGIIGAVGYAMSSPGDTPLPLTTEQRALWWRGALNMTSEHPLVGHGPNSYAVDGWHVRPTDDSLVHGNDFSDDTHSVPLAFLTGAGLLGLAGLIGVAVWGGLRAREIPGGDLLAAGFAAALAAYFVQSLVSIDEVALRTTLWVVLGGFVAALVPVEAAPKRTKKAAAKRTPRRAAAPVRALPAVAGLVLAALAILWWSGAFLLADARVRWGTDRYRAGDTAEGLADLRRAISFRGDYQYRHSNGFFLGRAAVAEERAGERWIEEMQDSYRFLDGFPWLPALLDQARALRDYSEFVPSYEDEAAALYERVARIDPHNVATFPEAIAAIAAAERYETVITLVEPVLAEVSEAMPSLWAPLALSYAETGRADDARNALARALELTPEDPLIEEIRGALE